MENEIYTIGRQYGSGGKEVGEKLAKKLGIPFYDRELIKQAAKASGLSEKVFELQDEKAMNSVLYSLVMNTYSVGSQSMPLNQQIFLAEQEAIKSIAQKHSCVIVGRCADYALSRNYDCLNIFVMADMDIRVNNVSNRFDVSEQKAQGIIQKREKERAAYYNFYTSKKWADAKSYDLMLNAGKISTEECTDVILEYRKHMK